MKRLIFSLSLSSAILAFAPAKSQSSIQLYDGNTPIASGTHIYVWQDTTESKIEKLIFAKNISSETVTLKAGKSEIDQLEDTKSSFCWGGQCYGSTTFTSVLSVNSLVNDIDTLSCDYLHQGHVGVSIVRYYVFNTANPDDSASVIIHFGATGVGIDDQEVTAPEISNPYPNPAISYTSFNYTFPKNTVNAKFVLRDLLGSITKEVEITDFEGKLTINTSNLNGGVYFYTFYVNDKLIQTRKLIIQH